MPHQVLRFTAGIVLILCAGQLAGWRELRCAIPLQDSAAPSAQDSTPQSKAQSAGATTEQKKEKKVWTNDNLGDARGPVSQVGDPKDAEKGKLAATAKPSNAMLIASFRKQLAALDVQMANADKQISDLKNFSKGEASNANGLDPRKHYTMESTDGQIHNLEEKKKQILVQIDGIFEAARKKGIEPGQLR